MSRVLVIYDSRTGRTEKLAEAVAEGARQVPGIAVELKRADAVTVQEVVDAEGYAFGSPSHYSIMSGKMLTLLTDLHAVRQKMAGKPMAVFTSGTGGQVTALENIDRIIGVFNPTFVKPGIAAETVPARANPWAVDRLQAAHLGERLAKAVVRKTRRKRELGGHSS
ncbi:MAG: flavodoxin domain-containing protein [Candidatus Bathyarchaeia archaeon]